MPPKKFKEPNSKAVAAKERKAAAKREDEERRRKEEEDEYWKDDDKHVLRKQDRKAEKERKRQDVIDKKVESKKLLELEESSLKGKSTGSGSSSSKMTRVQIAEAKVQSSGATPLPKGVIETDPLMDNPNHVIRQRKLEGHYDAETVDDALKVLSLKEDVMDRHPERRLKAAYAAFEEREIPIIKSENPNLRMSQVKQLVRKEWMKSPDNPMNQPHKSFNDKT